MFLPFQTYKNPKNFKLFNDQHINSFTNLTLIDEQFLIHNNLNCDILIKKREIFKHINMSLVQQL